jgi:heme/copper-type cytochrome/quinol oxidase subunit 3
MEADIMNPPAAEVGRSRTLVIGSALAAASVLMFFVGLFGVYIAIRQNNEYLVENGLQGGTLWFPELAVQIAPGTMMLFTTWFSAFTMAWAVQAIKNDDRRNAYVAIFLTILLGAAVINQMVFAISDFAVPVDRSVPSLLLYTLYGAYIAFLAAAIIYVLLMGIRALAGQFNSTNADGIQAAAMFWYTTVIVYAPLWYLITITK